MIKLDKMLWSFDVTSSWTFDGWEIATSSFSLSKVFFTFSLHQCQTWYTSRWAYILTTDIYHFLTGKSGIDGSGLFVYNIDCSNIKFWFEVLTDIDDIN